MATITRTILDAVPLVVPLNSGNESNSSLNSSHIALLHLNHDDRLATEKTHYLDIEYSGQSIANTNLKVITFGSANASKDETTAVLNFAEATGYWHNGTFLVKPSMDKNVPFKVL